MSTCSPSEGNRPSVEVADIFRDHLHELGSIGPEQWKVVNALISCRTARLGGHLYACDHCGQTLTAYNSCRNRHCPKCQAAARAKWLDERMDELLPVEYFHLVFTIPDVLNHLVLVNKAVLYEILFRAAKETLLQSATNPKNLGARVGFLAILHTWGQNLLDHPHLHCLVPGGGLSSDGTRWISCRKGFFVSVKILSALFRGKFLDFLKNAYQNKQLQFPGQTSLFESWEAFQKLLNRAYAKHWVVYAKKPFAGPEQVLRYLGRYTHRVAISNHRIIDVRDGIVRFRWKDYKHANAWKIMSVSTAEFMRRFLLYVLPTGFMRIRPYGLLSNRNKNQNLAVCRNLLCDSSETEQSESQGLSSAQPTATTETAILCPNCHHGHLVSVMIIEPELFDPGKTKRLDSS
jgi:hypothetical protein